MHVDASDCAVVPRDFAYGVVSQELGDEVSSLPLQGCTFRGDITDWRRRTLY